MNSQYGTKRNPDLRVVTPSDSTAHLPESGAEFCELVRWGLEGTDGTDQQVLQVAEDILLELSTDFDESPSPSSRVAAVYNLLRNAPDLQERLWKEIVGDNDTNKVEELVKSHQISFVTSRPALRNDLLQTPNARESVGIIADALLMAHPDKKSVNSLMASLDPAAFRFIGDDGISVLRSWAGFDSVAPGDLSDIPKIVARAVNGIRLRSRAQDEQAETLVNRMLQYPRDAFEGGFKTQSGRQVREFDPDSLKQSVTRFLSKLRTFQGLDGHPDESTINQYGSSLPEMSEFAALSPRCKQDVLNGLAAGRDKIEQLLTSRMQAECIGHDCEMLAARILEKMDSLEGMSGISFVQSRKESDTDHHGVDFRVTTPYGVAHIDVKGSYSAEHSSDAERADFSNRRGLARGIAFLPNDNGSVRIYRFPEQAVVNRSLSENEIAGNISSAIKRALTLPPHLLGQ